MKHPSTMRGIAISAQLFLITGAANAATVIFDDFEDGVLNPALWSTVLPSTGGTPSVAESGGVVTTQHRAHLNTVAEIDPFVSDVVVTGTFTFDLPGSGNFDSGFAQILTRSNGVPSAGFGETVRGIEVIINEGLDTVGFVGRGISGIDSQQTTFSMAVGVPYNFTLTDEGADGVFFTMYEQANPANSVTIFDDTLSGSAALPQATNLVTFHDREFISLSPILSTSWDNLRIETVPEPSAAILVGFSVFFGLVRRRRKG